MAALPITSVPTDRPAASARRRAWWLKTLYRWHWLSSAACLVGLLGFAVTGLTLNHAGAIESKPAVTTKRDRLPAALLAQLRVPRPSTDAALPVDVVAWLAERLDVHAQGRPGEWSDREIFVALPRPGGDASLTVSLVDGEVRHEATDRGWVSYFNDLHKGRNTGPAWRWFIDVFAAACLLFALTGLCLLYLHGRARPSTWPMVGLGIVMPLVVALLFVH